MGLWALAKDIGRLLANDDPIQKNTYLKGTLKIRPGGDLPSIQMLKDADEIPPKRIEITHRFPEDKKEENKNH